MQHFYVDLILINQMFTEKMILRWWGSINPYVPKGMIEAEQMQREYQNGQLAWAKLAESFNNSMQSPAAKPQDPRDLEEKQHD